jgi:hypothetical protein
MIRRSNVVRVVAFPRCQWEIPERERACRWADPSKCKYLYRVTLPKIQVQPVRWSFEFAAYWVVKTKERQGPDIEKPITEKGTKAVI